jgi:hypothetical protein
MLRTTETAVIDTPVNILMGRVLGSQNVLYSKALETLAFRHPYKNFFAVVYKDSQPEGAKIHNIKIFDYGVEVAHMTYYTPDSETRNKSQLQVRYNYEVQNKNPRDCKRSSDIRKIEQMILAIKPAELSHCDSKVNIEYAIDNCTDADKCLSEINAMSRDIYYAPKENQMATWASIFHGNDLAKRSNGKSYRETFMEAKAAYEIAKAETDKYWAHAVTVSMTPMGKYRVFHYTQVGGIVDKWIEDYDSRDALPEGISGQMAVLEIAESSEDREYPSGRHGNPPIHVSGVGMIHGLLDNMYTMIGGDFRDTRSQSQDEGS